jgi:hypothetical protein
MFLKSSPTKAYAKGHRTSPVIGIEEYVVFDTMLESRKERKKKKTLGSGYPFFKDLAMTILLSIRTTSFPTFPVPVPKYLPEAGQCGRGGLGSFTGTSPAVLGTGDRA